MAKFSFLCPVLLLCTASFSSALNYRAVIGILSRDMVEKPMPNKTSVIEAGYVKSLEASGARIVPILINQSKDYYQNILTKINGVLFPGGPDGDLKYDGYVKAGKIVFDMITQMNDKNDYFPLFGVGLGFELLSFLVAKRSWLSTCSATNLPATLNFSEGLDKSRMLGNLDSALKKVMEEKPVTFNYHDMCLVPKNYTRSKLDKYFKVLALSRDSRNETFISVVEGKKYPFYGIMFHPEKVQFNFVVADPINSVPHSLEAIQVAQYFSNFFVDEARKNTHQFPDLAVEDSMLIYNYNPVFTGKYGSGYIDEQIYFF
ncbi:gamma-glutamyl hydrolase-like [Uloborus diversus]|uniref:gamma-glutamyl hydrolase-like n=1 Tax=Uloborus diversus TaxID=327109 RepID=UPI002409D743|nr:gamma-glutamyl hydrolase-like [Uloborus diversus]